MITYWNDFVRTIRDILLASAFFAVCAFLNASMDITVHNFNGSVYSKVADFGTPTYKYFASYWTNKWQQSDTVGVGEYVADINVWLKLDENGERTPRWFLGIHIVPFNHPLFFDSWHLFKATMIFFFAITIIIVYFKSTKIIFKFNKWKYWAVLGIILLWFFIEWNLIFNLFYDTILRL